MQCPDAGAEEEVEVPTGEEQELLLKVVTIAGDEVCSLQAVGDTTIAQLKQEIVRKGAASSASATAFSSASVQSFKLLLGSQAPPDCSTMSELGVQTNAVLQLVRLTSQHLTAVVRVRPLSQREVDSGEQHALSIDPQRGVAILEQQLHDETARRREIEVDAVYAESCTQEELFNNSVRSLVEDVLEGCNATVLVYGPSFSGKRHTFFGNDAVAVANDQDVAAWDAESLGLLPRSLNLLSCLMSFASGNKTFVVRASFLEIVGNQVFDLLGNGEGRARADLRVRTRKDGAPFVDGLSFRPAMCAEDLRQAYKDGLARHYEWIRAFGATNSRTTSLMFTVEVQAQEGLPDGQLRTRSATLTLVKLGGSERPERPVGLTEGPMVTNNITRALHSVVAALAKRDKKKVLVPYRDSKLTLLLKDSLGGSARTLVIATCSPAGRDLEETLSTLRFCQFARKVEHVVTPHEVVHSAETSLGAAVDAGDAWLQAGGTEETTCSMLLGYRPGALRYITVER